MWYQFIKDLFGLQNTGFRPGRNCRHEIFFTQWPGWNKRISVKTQCVLNKSPMTCIQDERVVDISESVLSKLKSFSLSNILHFSKLAVQSQRKEPIRNLSFSMWGEFLFHLSCTFWAISFGQTALILPQLSKMRGSIKKRAQSNETRETLNKYFLEMEFFPEWRLLTRQNRNSLWECLYSSKLVSLSPPS